MSVLPRATTIHNANAIREGVAIIRKIFATQDTSKGFTSSELYQLALREPVPPNYQGDPRLAPSSGIAKNIAVPPHNEHPVRSKVFLKRSILPVLEGSCEISKVVTDREATAPIPIRGKKGKILAQPKKGTAAASPANPISVKAWVWKPTDPSRVKVDKLKSASSTKASFGAAVGVGEDWSHLNKRRQGSREEKVRRDLGVVRELRAQQKLAARAALSS